VRNWRIITAAAAVVLAMLAAVLAYQYLTEADERAEDKVEQVEAYVVTREIPKGTTGASAIEQGLIEFREVTKKDLPPSAIASDDQITDLVAASTLVEGQIVVSEMFQSANAVSGFSGRVEEGMMAVTFQVDSQQGVGGFIVPGDSINAMVTFEATDVTKASSAVLQTTAYLIPDLEVLAVGSTTADTQVAEGEQPAAQNLGLITVSATPREAQQIAHAQNGAGVLYISLNAPGFDPEEFEIPVEIVEAINWFDQNLAFLAGALESATAAQGSEG
jgi:pilus assembly protein CpaB